MGALKKILRAILDDDGAPSLYSALVVGAPTSGRHQTGASGGGSRRDAAGSKAPARRS